MNFAALRQTLEPVISQDEVNEMIDETLKVACL